MKFWNTFVLCETLDRRHTSSRGRHPSPSLPVWEARNLKSKHARAESDLRAEISGSNVKIQCSSNASRPYRHRPEVHLFVTEIRMPMFLLFHSNASVNSVQTIPFFSIFFFFHSLLALNLGMRARSYCSLLHLFGQIYDWRERKKGRQKQLRCTYLHNANHDNPPYSCTGIPGHRWLPYTSHHASRDLGDTYLFLF